MIGARIKRGLMIGLPPLVFSLALVMGWYAAAPHKQESSETEGSRRLSPRQQAAQAEHSLKRVSPRSKIAKWEPYIGRSIPTVEPEVSYNAAGLEAAMRHSWTVDDYRLRDGGDYADAWIEHSPEEIYQWMMAGNTWLNGFMVNDLFEIWAEKDLSGAHEAAFDIKVPEMRAQAVMAVACIMSKSDFQGAATLLLDHLEQFQATKREISFHEALPFDGFIKLIDSLPEGEVQTTFLAELVQHGGTYEEKTAYWDALSREKRMELIEAGLTIQGYGSNRRLDGIEDLMREHAEGEGGSHKAYHLISVCGEEWVKNDFEEALDWVNEHVKGQYWAYSMEKIWREAASHDLENTLQVWEKLPEGYMKKKMAKEIANTAAGDKRDELLERLIGK